MTKITTYRMPYRRRREGKTNYQKRLGLIKGKFPRMIIRKSNRDITVQFVEFGPNGDRVKYGTTSIILKKIFGWPSKRNCLTAYLIGLYAAKQAKKKGIVKFIADIGMHSKTKGAIVFAALKGAVDAGIETSYNEEMVPIDKINTVPSTIKEIFNSVKEKILSS